MKKVIVSFVALGTLAFAASSTFKVNLLQDSTIEGKAIKAGEYKVSVENGNAIFKQGKDMIEVPAHEETQTNKVSSTVLQYQNGTNLQEIRLGGTHTRIVFDGSGSMHSGM
jgi:hypothetical protein